ncbi:unnamed protein product [Laminaria digitata]
MRDNDDIPFAKTVLAVGEGSIEPVLLPDGTPAIHLESLIDSVYPDLLEVNHNAYNDRGILAPPNDNIDHINDSILNRITGRSHHLLSTDKIIIDDENMPDVVSVEYLNSVQVPGTPPHDQHLKIGALVFFIRNINFDSGLVNGKKRRIIRGISQRVIDVEVMSEDPLIL